MQLPNQSDAPHTDELYQEPLNDNLMAFIRNRLNVIGTSMYLLEKTLQNDPISQQKYINTIKYQLEMLRQSINR